jgi:hypothetical protein
MSQVSGILNLSCPFVEISPLSFTTNVSEQALNPSQESYHLNSSEDENILNKVDSVWNNFTPFIRGKGFTWTHEELEILYKIMLGEGTSSKKIESAVAALPSHNAKSCGNKWTRRKGALLKFNRPWSESDTVEFEALMKKPGPALSNLELISQSFKRPFLECFAKWDELEREAGICKNNFWKDEEMLVLVKEMLNTNLIVMHNAENAAKKLKNKSQQACFGQWNRLFKKEKFLSNPIFTKASSWSEIETTEFEQIFKSSSASCKEKIELTSEKLQRPFLECFAKWILCKDSLPETDIENVESDSSDLQTKENIPPTKKRKVTHESTHWKSAELEILFKHMTKPETFSVNMQRASDELKKRSPKACRITWVKHRAKLETDKSLILKYGEVKCLNQRKLPPVMPEISALDILAFAATDLKV